MYNVSKSLTGLESVTLSSPELLFKEEIIDFSIFVKVFIVNKLCTTQEIFQLGMTLRQLHKILNPGT